MANLSACILQDKDFTLKGIKKRIIFSDCFGTIILRKLKPEELIKVWSVLAGSLIGIGGKSFYSIFTRTKIKLTLSYIFRTFSLEPPMEEVLLKMSRNPKIKNLIPDPELFAEQAFNLYLKTEEENQFCNESLKEELSRAKAAGAKIYLVSDFYCSAKVLEGWLTKIGCSGLFDGIYSSCDHKLDKATGRLYTYLVRKLNLNCKDILMIGDNPWSDNFIPTLLKIQSRRIK